MATDDVWAIYDFITEIHFAVGTVIQAVLFLCHFTPNDSFRGSHRKSQGNVLNSSDDTPAAPTVLSADKLHLIVSGAYRHYLCS